MSLAKLAEFCLLSTVKGSLNKQQQKAKETGYDLIQLAQDRDQWRALVYRIMNLRAG
jgi:hypothetical protein